MTHNPFSVRSVRKKTIWMLFLLFILVSPVYAQRNPNQELPLNELLKLRGKLIAEGVTGRAVGNQNITGYRVEELQLPRSMNVELHGQQVSVDRAWRITLNGGRFPVRALPAVIWIDDQIAGLGVENETLTQISAITFDGSLIREGALISLSYGEDKDARLKPAQRLHLKGGGNK